MARSHAKHFFAAVATLKIRALRGALLLFTALEFTGVTCAGDAALYVTARRCFGLAQLDRSVSTRILAAGGSSTRRMIGWRPNFGTARSAPLKVIGPAADAVRRQNGARVGTARMQQSHGTESRSGL